MTRIRASVVVLSIAMARGILASAPAAPLVFPANRATGVNPDTHLQLTFAEAPIVGSRGTIRIDDVTDGTVADTIDLAIPAGAPASGDRDAAAAGRDGQRTVIGGFTEGFHFYPVIVHGTRVTIYPHQHALTYGKTYRVELGAGVFAASGQAGAPPAVVDVLDEVRPAALKRSDHGGRRRARRLLDRAGRRRFGARSTGRPRHDLHSQRHL